MDVITAYLNQAPSQLRILDLSDNEMSKQTLIGVLVQIKLLRLEELFLCDQNFGNEPSNLLC